MYDEVGVAADGGGEVAVVGLGEAVMAERLGGVGGALEGFEEAELDDVFLRASFGFIEQFLDVAAVGEVSGAVAVEHGGLGVFQEAGGVGIFVDSIDGGFAAGFEEMGDGFVGD